MRRKAVSVTTLADFAACETRHLLRAKHGDRRSPDDLRRAQAGSLAHQRHDRFQRRYGSTGSLLWQTFRTAVLVGTPLSLLGVLLYHLDVSQEWGRTLMYVLVGSGIAGIGILPENAGWETRTIIFSIAQLGYFCVLSAVVHGVFTRRVS